MYIHVKKKTGTWLEAPPRCVACMHFLYLKKKGGGGGGGGGETVKECNNASIFFFFFFFFQLGREVF